MLLPCCYNEQSTIDSIFADVKANTKTPHKYRAYRQALAGESDENFLDRLIYAETKAANCTECESEIMPIVAAVIRRRIELRGGNIQSIIFERDQFASSLNNYSESNYRDFLCPSDSKAWNQALDLTTGSRAKAEGVVVPKDAVHYYFYKHSSHRPLGHRTRTQKMRFRPVKMDNSRTVFACSATRIGVKGTFYLSATRCFKQQCQRRRRRIVPDVHHIR